MWVWRLPWGTDLKVRFSKSEGREMSPLSRGNTTCKGPGVRGSKALSQTTAADTESRKNKVGVGRGQMFGLVPEVRFWVFTPQQQGTTEEFHWVGKGRCVCVCVYVCDQFDSWCHQRRDGRPFGKCFQPWVNWVNYPDWVGYSIGHRGWIGVR